MSQNVTSFFTESDLERVRGAVAAVERKTRGEIVPFVAERSDPYVETLWQAGALGGILALLLWPIFRIRLDYWSVMGIFEPFAVPLVVGAICGLMTALLPWLRRTLAGRRMLDYRTSQRAMEAFVEAEVFNTRDRTGILIYLSLFERSVIVLGDKGINEKVKQSEWDGVVKTIVDAIGAGRPADGLVSAIEQCGLLLERAGFAVRPDDTNELPDDLRVSG